MRKINNVDLKLYTTYKLEGKIKTLYLPENVLELKELIIFLNDKKIKYKILGNGSNVIINPNYDGVLIKLKNFDKLVIDGDRVTVECGYMLFKLALKCAMKNLGGLEFATFPATVGGAIYQNAGAFGINFDKLIEKVTVLDKNGKIFSLSKDELDLGYRDSIFKHHDLICLDVTLKLKKDDKAMEKINYNKKWRSDRQPLDYPSAGSVFKNPLGMSAGKLIEDAGLKGTRVGDAMVSLKHANFIVNMGRASFDDIVNLIKLIQKEVKNKTGVLLELEQEIIE